MRENPLSTIESNFVLKCLSDRSRLDGREPFAFRPIKIEFGKDLGCCIVDLGNTKVLAQVDAEIDRPRESRPSEGRINIHVEMSQMASPSFNPGKPGDLGVELQRMLERSIVVSRSVDLEELCVRVGERVWKLDVHVHILSHDGNILDCASIAAITALAHFRRPDISVTGKDVTIHTLDEKQPLPLIMNHYPFCVSFGLFNTGELLVLDPCELEERVMDGRLMIAMNKHREVCCMQMSGRILVNKEQVMRCTNIAYTRVKDIAEFVKKALENDISEKKCGKTMSISTNSDKLPENTKNQFNINLQSSMETQEDTDTEIINKSNLNNILKQGDAMGEGKSNSWIVDSARDIVKEVKINNDVVMSDGEEEMVVMEQKDVGVFVQK